MTIITKKSVYEALAKAGFVYIKAVDMDNGGEVANHVFLTSIYDPGPLLGYAQMAKDRSSVQVGPLDPIHRHVSGAKRCGGVERHSADAVVTTLLEYRRQEVALELPKGDGPGLLDKVKKGRK